jgi:polyhydroxyalkanoate synthesis regulator phasin
MHQDAFEDLADDVQAARREWDRGMNQRLREMVDHFETVLDEFDHPAV